MSARRSISVNGVPQAARVWHLTMRRHVAALQSTIHVFADARPSPLVLVAMPALILLVFGASNPPHHLCVSPQILRVKPPCQLNRATAAHIRAVARAPRLALARGARTRQRASHRQFQMSFAQKPCNRPIVRVMVQTIVLLVTPPVPARDVCGVQTSKTAFQRMPRATIQFCRRLADAMANRIVVHVCWPARALGAMIPRNVLRTQQRLDVLRI